MLVGYMRVSKTDGSQTTDPQRDASVEASVDDERLYEDTASGRLDDRPGLAGGRRVHHQLSAIGPRERISQPRPLLRVGRILVSPLRTRG